MTKPECAVEECPKPSHTRGWCQAHYNRWYRHGDPLASGTRRYRAPKTCTLQDCERAYHARGYCERHYSRLRFHGSLDGVAYDRYVSHEEAFAARTEWQGECLVWTGTPDRTGYARLHVDGRRAGAHRYAWEQEHGPIPEGMVVMHSCDNPPCVNINHLSLGTPRDNTQDMIQKGRARWQKPSGAHATRVRDSRGDDA